MQGFDPHRLTAEDDPYPSYREMRETHPLYYSEEREIWVVSRYEDVRAVLTDAETFSSSLVAGARSPLLVLSDGERHRRLRGVLAAASAQSFVL